MYNPKLVHFYKVSGAASVGYGLRAGESRAGARENIRTEIPAATIELTDGYTVESDEHLLSIDPATGTATFSYRVDPDPGDPVAAAMTYPLVPDDQWELRYGNTLINQGRVGKVATRMEARGHLWIRRITYQLVGVASLALASTAEWDFLPEESALARLRRWFTVTTTRLDAAQLGYIDTEVLAPGRNAGSSSLLDLAREFTALTAFPVRPVASGTWNQLDIVPALNFRGIPPTPLPGTAETWTGAADFSRDLTYPTRAESVDIPTDHDAFLAGIETVSTPGTPIGTGPGSLMAGASRLGGTYQSAVGIQVPAVLDVFGTRLIVSRVRHSFTPTSYRSTIDLTAPADVT